MRLKVILCLLAFIPVVLSCHLDWECKKCLSRRCVFGETKFGHVCARKITPSMAVRTVFRKNCNGTKSDGTRNENTPEEYKGNIKWTHMDSERPTTANPQVHTSRPVLKGNVSEEERTGSSNKTTFTSHLMKNESGSTRVTADDTLIPENDLMRNASGRFTDAIDAQDALPEFPRVTSEAITIKDNQIGSRPEEMTGGLKPNDETHSSNQAALSSGPLDPVQIPTNYSVPSSTDGYHDPEDLYTGVPSNKGISAEIGTVLDLSYIESSTRNSIEFKEDQLATLHVPHAKVSHHGSKGSSMEVEARSKLNLSWLINEHMSSTHSSIWLTDGSSSSWSPTDNYDPEAANKKTKSTSGVVFELANVLENVDPGIDSATSSDSTLVERSEAPLNFDKITPFSTGLIGPSTAGPEADLKSTLIGTSNVEESESDVPTDARLDDLEPTTEIPNHNLTVARPRDENLDFNLHAILQIRTPTANEAPDPNFKEPRAPQNELQILRNPDYSKITSFESDTDRIIELNRRVDLNARRRIMEDSIRRSTSTPPSSNDTGIGSAKWVQGFKSIEALTVVNGFVFYKSENTTVGYSGARFTFRLLRNMCHQVRLIFLYENKTKQSGLQRLSLLNPMIKFPDLCFAITGRTQPVRNYDSIPKNDGQVNDCQLKTTIWRSTVVILIMLFI